MAGRRWAAAVMSVAVALLAVGCTSDSTHATQRAAARHPATRASRTNADTGDSISSALSKPARLDGPMTVTRVVDGDTIKVSNGKTLRLIGIDTPEVFDPRKPVQCFGREASARAHALLDGTQVQLEYDPTQGRLDKYGRTLAYVWMADGRLYNETIIAEGYAHQYTYDLPYRYRDAFVAAERAARTAERGLWSATTCAGDTTAPAGTTTPSPTPAAGSSGCDPSYPDVCIPPPPPDLDCTQIPFRDFRVTGPDPHRFDANHDGLGCDARS